MKEPEGWNDFLRDLPSKQLPQQHALFTLAEMIEAFRGGLLKGAEISDAGCDQPGVAKALRKAAGEC